MIEADDVAICDVLALVDGKLCTCCLIKVVGTVLCDCVNFVLQVCVVSLQFATLFL